DEGLDEGAADAADAALPEDADAVEAAPPQLPRLGAGHPTLDAMIARAAGGDGQLMVLHVDIEQFASVNQNMGTEVGDAALQIIGQRLRAGLAGRGDVWRHGSDEFVAAARLEEGGHSAQQISEALIALVEQPLTILPYTLMLK